MYLSSLHIKNFRGIKDLTLNFDSKLNVLIGPNGKCKTAVIDAIRLFYSRGTQQPLAISVDDFYQAAIYDESHCYQSHEVSRIISIEYNFDGLTNEQEGLFYQYLVPEEERLFARVTLLYTLEANNRIKYDYFTGKEYGQKADPETLAFFVSYYLGALRDSTKDLLSPWDNRLGAVITRKIRREQTENSYLSIIKDANDRLLALDEVDGTKALVNNTLERIDNRFNLGLRIEERKIERIVNLIKPFLPHEDGISGFQLSQNSLGYNNVLYIATVLCDLEECHKEEEQSHYVLLIEEPEAHLHPQLQVNLYNFLINADDNKNCQIFITSHSPTLTSKVPFNNLIVINEHAIKVSDIFKYHKENLSLSGLKKEDIEKYERMLHRYLDVTRSQLFFSNGCVLVEGISEALLMECFANHLGKSLTRKQIEILNLEGTAFTQFLLLFMADNEKFRLPFQIAVITDEDQFTDSKRVEFSLDSITSGTSLNTLRNGILDACECTRVSNLRTLKTNDSIEIFSGQKTLEYQICKANVYSTIRETRSKWFYKFLERVVPDKMQKIALFLDQKEQDHILSDTEQMDVSLLLWKACPSKSEFAQELVSSLECENSQEFNVPEYIKTAITLFDNTI